MGVSKKRLVKEFLELVRIDSISKEERAIADNIKRKLRGLGFKVREDGAGKKLGGTAGNIIARLPGVKNITPLLFNAHLDTHVPGKNIRPRVARNYIRSSGDTILGADDKAGVAAIMEMLRVVKEEELSHGDLSVIFTVAEEIGLAGAKQLQRRNIKAKAGFAIDGEYLGKVVISAPSQDNLIFHIKGKAAHAGVHPERGISAIKVAAEAIVKLKQGRICKETTANIGTIHGGVATNIVPEEVEVKGEARSRSERKLKKQVRHMREVFKRTCRRHGAKLKVEQIRMYDAFRLDENSLPLRFIRRTGRPFTLVDGGGGSDANVLNKLGVPTVILGVGGRGAHTTKESLFIPDFIAGTEQLVDIVKAAIK